MKVINMKGTIIFVTGSLNLSGADFSMYAVIKKLKKEGYKTLIIIPKECKSSSFWKKQKIEYITVPFKLWTTSKSNIMHRFIVHNIKKIYNKYQIQKNYKRILSSSKNDIVCIYNNGFTNDFAVKLSQKLKKPCVYHIREFGDLDFKWNFEVGNKAKQFQKIEKKVKLFIAISNTVKKSFSNAKNYDKIKVIHNGIETVKIQNKLQGKIKKIIISGRLAAGKGHITLLKAIKKLISSGITNIKLDIYGDGKERENIENFIKENNLQNYVELKGFILGIDYQQYDIGIMASRAEAFGRVTVEYMMNGLVTIAANSGANPELITNYIDGILFSPNNEIDLANKIMEVINSEKMRKSISKNAIKTAQEKFSEETYVNNIYNLLISENIIK